MKKLALLIPAALVVVTLLATWLWLRPDLTRLDAMITSAECTPVPARVIAAILAVEDPHYLERQRSLRFAWPRHGCAPTVTYHFVRLASARSERPLAHLWRTSLLCAIVQWHYTPAQVLRAYAQNAYLGRTGPRAIIGVDAASRAYFGLAPDALNDEQIAALVSTFYCPNACSPQATSESAIQRRQMALRQMRTYLPR